MNTVKTNVFIKSVKIVDPNSKWNGKKVSIAIENGVITEIGNAIKPPKKCKVIDEKNLHVSPGWVDLLADFGEPGYEHKETFETGLQCAAKGGFTGVLTSSYTLPVTDNRSGIEFVLNRSKSNVVDVFPTGALSKGLKGEEMAEMEDMHDGGAVAFSDYKNSVLNPGLLLKALIYTKSFNGLILHFPAEERINNHGQINEGVMSTKLGLKPIPEIGEELMVSRDIKLASYANQKLHFSMIATSDAVQQIKAAKKKGIDITCGVSSYHLLLDEEQLEQFDSNYKVLPPLKDKTTINTLIKGLKDDTIDVIVSDHSPQNVELKECEFDRAAFGIINLETSFAAANTALKKHLDIEQIISKISLQPRKILGLEIPSINPGNKANLTFFNPDQKWTYKASESLSTSSNSPLFGKELIGSVIGIYNKGLLSTVK